VKRIEKKGDKFHCKFLQYSGTICTLIIFAGYAAVFVAYFAPVGVVWQAVLLALAPYLVELFCDIEKDKNDEEILSLKEIEKKADEIIQLEEIKKEAEEKAMGGEKKNPSS